MVVDKCNETKINKDKKVFPLLFKFQHKIYTPHINLMFLVEKNNSVLNSEKFDTKYAYIHVGNQFKLRANAKYKTYTT